MLMVCKKETCYFIFYRRSGREGVLLILLGTRQTHVHICMNAHIHQSCKLDVHWWLLWTNGNTEVIRSEHMGICYTMTTVSMYLHPSSGEKAFTAVKLSKILKKEIFDVIPIGRNLGIS